MTTKLPPCDLVELDQELAQLVDQARIDARAGLVEQHQPRRRHERHRDVDELLLAVGQASRRQVRDVREAEVLDHLVGVPPEAGVGRGEQPAGQRALELLRGDDQVVAHRQLAEHLQRLERAADAAPASSSGDMPVMSSPQNSTRPAVGLIWPRMLLKSVVLPEPFGPITPTISPGPTESDTPSTARIAP